jgi:hypothetical protein
MPAVDNQSQRKLEKNPVTIESKRIKYLGICLKK